MLENLQEPRFREWMVGTLLKGGAGEIGCLKLEASGRHQLVAERWTHPDPASRPRLNCIAEYRIRRSSTELTTRVGPSLVPYQPAGDIYLAWDNHSDGVIFEADEDTLNVTFFTANGVVANLGDYPLHPSQSKEGSQ